MFYLIQTSLSCRQLYSSCAQIPLSIDHIVIDGSDLRNFWLFICFGLLIFGNSLFNLSIKAHILTLLDIFCFIPGFLITFRAPFITIILLIHALLPLWKLLLLICRQLIIFILSLISQIDSWFTNANLDVNCRHLTIGDFWFFGAFLDGACRQKECVCIFKLLTHALVILTDN